MFRGLSTLGDLPASSGDGGISTVLGHGSAIPTIVFHGDRDNTVHPRNGDHVIAQKWTTNLQKKVHRGRVPGERAYTCTIHTDVSGRAMLEQWEILGAGHAWSGGSPAGSYTDPRGPDAAREMLRFFLEHPRPVAEP
jgi:poly(3-hydroxybutyrate) depolymerase